MNRPFYTMSWHTLGRLLRAGWRVRAEGLEHVPGDGPAILASNHLSYLDHFLMPAVVPRPVWFVAKAQHFDVPIQRWLFAQWGAIPVRRGEGDGGALAKAQEALDRGELFGIYPEGTRSLDGHLHKGHTGVARLALASRAPVVPVGMVGTFEALPKGARLPKLRKVTVRFGPPLTFEDHWDRQDDRKVTRAVTDDIMAAIGGLTGQRYVDEYQRNPEYVPKDQVDDA